MDVPDPFTPVPAASGSPGRDAAIREVVRRIRADDPRTLRDQISIARISAPTGHEAARGRFWAELLRECGIGDIATDAVGNVVARFPGRGADRPGLIVLSAHLDTVVAEGVAPRIRETGEGLSGPGAVDDARGLAALVALVRAMRGAGFTPPVPLLVAATVGEEGLGNLRGVRHLLGREGAGAEATAFISLDGAGSEAIVHRGLGVERFRLRITGPGGHSWGDRGVPNPIHLLARVVGAAEAPARRAPSGEGGGSSAECSATVSRWGGGTAINAIPSEAWIEVDLRSENPEALALALERWRDAARQEVDGERHRAASLGVDGPALEWIGLGSRPAGATPPDHPLVRAAVSATRAVGGDPFLIASSTDANHPMSVGIPAITLGAGGIAGGIHTAGEWYRNEGGPDGIVRAFLTLSAL